MMTMCQMGAVNVPAHILMSLIVEAFPIAVFCRQLGNSHRCITEVVEAYGALDGEARTRTLFAYEPTKDGGGLAARWGHLPQSGGAHAQQRRGRGGHTPLCRRTAIARSRPQRPEGKSAAKGQAASDVTEGHRE